MSVGASRCAYPVRHRGSINEILCCNSEHVALVGGGKGYLSLVTAPVWATVPRPGWSSYGRYAILMVGAPSTLKMQIAAGPLVQFRYFDSYPVRLSKIRSGRHQADWLQQTSGALG